MLYCCWKCIEHAVVGRVRGKRAVDCQHLCAGSVSLRINKWKNGLCAWIACFMLTRMLILDCVGAHNFISLCLAPDSRDWEKITPLSVRYELHWVWISIACIKCKCAAVLFCCRRSVDNCLIYVCRRQY